MKKLIIISLLILAVLFTGCEAADPIYDDLYTTASYIRLASDDSGGYWHEYNLDALNLSPGGTGSLQIAPNASTLGGYQLNAINEYLYFTTHVDTDWDSTTDGLLEIWFEVNDDNSGGLDTDTVKTQIEVWHKLVGERTCTVYSLDGNTVVGKAQQHDLFEQDIVIGHLRAGDVLSFRINNNTILGDVTDIIINYVEFKYRTYLPQMEYD